MLLGAAAALFHFYTSGFGTPGPRTMRGLHLFMLLPLVYLLFPASSRSPKERPSVLDLGASLLCMAASVFTVLHADRLNRRFLGFHEVLPIEVVLGGLMVLAVIEACRRALSKWMAVTISVALVYLMTCQYWPGMFQFKGFTLERAVEILYLSGDDGIFGFLTGISADILFIYILFATVMTAARVGDFLVDFAVWAAGWARGGAAKIAVIASALYGSVSGSTVANVYATGSFTIPLMKKHGYTPKQAAAIEAISGTGGQIMPPIMGAGVFIMSEMTGVPYFKIIQMAVLPAVLYYLGVFAMVHLLALKGGLEPLPRSERPPARSMLRRVYLFTPFVVILLLMAYGYSPAKAAFHTVWFTFLLSFLHRRTWLTPKKILDALVKASVNAGLIAAALAGSGMVVGILTRTGVALSFGSLIMSASQGSLFLCMLLIFVVVSVLGTGIPTTAAYIIAVTVGAQALGNLGIAVLTAHLFVFYYAVLSDLTPPDAVTAFAAANLAGSEMMATGIEAFRLGFAGFLVPFVFVYQPALLLTGDLSATAISFLLAGLGVICLAGATIGHLASPLGWVERILLVAAAFLLVFPSKGLELAGIGAAAALGLWSWSRGRRTRKAFASSGELDDLSGEKSAT